MAEGECDSVRTVDCLRGRLLAERLASRSANDEALHLENKMTELENMLNREVKSKNRADKRTKLLLKKLDSTGKSVISHTPSTCSSEQVSESSFLTDSGSEGQNGNSLFPTPPGSDRSDDSMALVVIDEENRTHDSNAVQDVLDALEHAKALLRSSMEKRQLAMVRVG